MYCVGDVYKNDDFVDFLKSIKENTNIKQCMYLNIFITDEDEKLKNLYYESVKKHNNNILLDPHFYDAGFDLFLPKYVSSCKCNEEINEDGHLFKTIDGNDETVSIVNKINFNIKCSAIMVNIEEHNMVGNYSPFYIYARSSLSKTPLRLSNNQGIIDAGYRGNIIGMFDNIMRVPGVSTFFMENYSKMVQICAPSLVPIYVNIVNSVDELSSPTKRGDGGFGSTGK